MDTPQENEEQGALESLESKLYSPKGKIDNIAFHHVRDRKEKELPSSWGDDTPILRGGEDEGGLSFGAKFLVGAVILLLFVLAFTAWRVLSNRNIVSEKNIDMSLNVASFVDGGEPTALTVNLTNRNQVPLEEATLTLMYKQGISAIDEEEKVQEKQNIGTINSGEFKNQDFQIQLYGGEAEARDLTVKLDYKVKGSNAVFSKTGIVQVVLKTPPLSVQVDGPKILSAGQAGTYVFTVYNSTATTSQPASMQAILPANFRVTEQTPKPLNSRNSIWQIPPLAPGSTSTISITGSLDGNQGEVATLKAVVGSQGAGLATVGVVYSSQTLDVSLRVSPLSLSMSLDTLRGVGSGLIYGDRATISIQYKNTSSDPLQDASLRLSIEGNAAIMKGITSDRGYYDSTRGVIVWDKATDPTLALVRQGGEGTYIVNIPIVASGSNSPKLNLTLSGSGTISSENDVTTTLSRTYVVQGSASISGSAAYKNSPFLNTGPIPPQANADTTYALHLSVSAQNALENATVSFVLPAYVSWRNVVSKGAAVTYDAGSRTVTWTIGKLDAGGTTSADIGVSVRPSQVHVGNMPAITGGIVLNADEAVSKAHIRTTISGLTTYIGDEGWKTDPSRVVDN